MEVFLNQETRWEIDEEKIFVLYEIEWDDFLTEKGIFNGTPSDEVRKEFVLKILWELVPHFEELGGIETYDDARIDVFFTQGVR